MPTAHYIFTGQVEPVVLKRRTRCYQCSKEMLKGTTAYVVFYMHENSNYYKEPKWCGAVECQTPEILQVEYEEQRRE